MDLVRLSELEGLFGHRYQALALIALLEDGPMRWSELGRAMHRRAADRVDDKYVTRSLQALEKGGYVEAAADDSGSQVRALTRRGIEKAHRIKLIFARLDHQAAALQRQDED